MNDDRDLQQKQDSTDGETEKPDARSDFLIVGVGASAGGFEAFQTFLRKMPDRTGMAFVFISHLDPTRESLMPELLGKLTGMEVRQAADGEKVEPDHVYVIPPNKTLLIENGRIGLRPPIETRGLRLPIDAFFRSLADDQRENAVAVVLSGAGSDGTAGIRSVKENGGIVFVQDAGSARYDSMPRSAILTGLADHVMPMEELPGQLLEFARHREVLKAEKGTEGIRAELTGQLGEICRILLRRTGNDFKDYKQNTLLRRVLRRIQVTRSGSVEEYLGKLRDNTSVETEQLFKDLLIGVTDFFRDPEAFETFRKEVLPEILKGKTNDDTVRVWVPGCATGEEAYTLAMLLSDECEKRNLRAALQIFATDIDETSLNTARRGVYPENIAQKLPPGYLERFFVREDGNYRIAGSLRDVCLFSAHNLIKHPPFSRIDLISCRNLLIYLDREIQKKVFPIFHYSLRKGGFLFLGSSESVGEFTDLFRTLSKKHRLFQARDTVIEPRFDFPLGESGHVSRMRTGQAAQSDPPDTRPDVGKVIENILLEKYAPACVIVNGRGEAVYFFGRTGKYLEPAAGTPNYNILNMARRGLRIELRTALHKAAADGGQVVRKNISIDSGESIRNLDLTVRPLTEFGSESDLYLIVFQEAGPPLPAGGEEDERESDGDRNARELEKELRMTKEHLQTTIEELETTNEELKSSNEELLSMNEELQSSNEELQTSKEEMQSINEELETVNTELRNKIEELDAANSDLQNLFQSTEIATIFLDRELRVKKFTPAATDVFRLIGTDVGRPITDLVPRLAGVDLAADVRNVLKSLRTIEREVRLSDSDEFYSMRIIPYRTVDDVIDGVVITFIDITYIRKARLEAEKRARLQEGVAELGLFAIQTADLPAVFDRAVRLACDVLGVELAKILRLSSDGESLIMVSGCGWDEGMVGQARVGAERDSQAGFTLLQSSAVVVEDLPTEERFQGPPLLTEHGVKSGMSVVIHGREEPWGVFGIHSRESLKFGPGEINFLHSIANIVGAAVQQEDSKTALHENRQRLALALEAGEMGAWEWELETDRSIWSEKLYKLLGMEISDTPSTGDDFFRRVHPEDREDLLASIRKVVGERTEYHREFRIIRDDDRTVRWLVGRGNLIFSADGEPVRMVGVNYDITEQKENEEKLRHFNRELEERVAERTAELNTLNAELRVETEQKIYLLQQLVTTQEDERSRIARDIHDQLGQQMTALRLNLENLKKTDRDGPELSRKIKEIEEIALELDSDVGFMAWKLRPAALDDLGLVAALENYVREWNRHFEIRAGFHSTNMDNHRLSPEAEINLYRIAQEALNNVSKHAGAANVDVLLERHDDRVTLIIEDDGRGFPVDDQTAGNSRIGISGMRERAELIGGSLEIESKPGEGTTVFVRLPENGAEE